MSAGFWKSASAFGSHADSQPAAGAYAWAQVNNKPKAVHIHRAIQFDYHSGHMAAGSGVPE
jgi:hypothetical protein